MVQEVVTAIRAIRAEYGIQPGRTVRAVVSRSEAGDGALGRERLTVSRLAKVSDLSFGEPGERVGGHAVLSDGTAVFVPLGDAIDVARECQRLSGEMQRLTQLVESQDRKLGNEQFVSRAPADVVQREREKAATWREQREVLSRKLELLGCGS
jgi:valyl-tRNA synthetase